MLIVTYHATNPNDKMDNEFKKVAKKHGYKFKTSGRDMKTHRRDLIFVDKGDDKKEKRINEQMKPKLIIPN